MTDINKGIKGGTTEIPGASTIALDYSNNRTNSKTKTLATLGSGNIQIANKEDSNTKMLNRDTANNTVDIYNISSHKGLKGELDTRLVTSEGRKEIVKDVKVATAHTVNVTTLAGNIASGNMDLDNAFESFKDPYKTADTLKKDIEVAAAIDAHQKGESDDLVRTQDALNKLNPIDGVNAELTTVTADGLGVQGTTNKELIAIDTNKAQRENTIFNYGHELSHVRGGESETLADMSGFTTDLLAGVSIDSYGSSLNNYKANTGIYNNTPTIQANNAKLLNTNNTNLLSKYNSEFKDRQLSNVEIIHINTVASDYAKQTTVSNLVGRKSQMDENTAKALLATAALYYNDKDMQDKINDDLKYVSASRFTLKQIQDAGDYLKTSADGKIFLDMYNEDNMQYQNMFTSTQAQFNNPNHIPEASIGLESNPFVVLPTTRVVSKVISTTAKIIKSSSSKIDDVILNTGIKADNLIQNKVVPAVKDGYYRTANVVTAPDNIVKAIGVIEITNDILNDSMPPNTGVGSIGASLKNIYNEVNSDE